ncbi:MAG: TIGR04282 family arsenosugar biosynthesis glycosyltransferase [Desulfobacterales bacterium]|nr:TIGR04282 family arsenosugar biosynthesis glycosyltransferase [Desulfobacterales bacterium]
MLALERLILFTRYPEAGVTKTRLIPALGPEGAADLQRRMTAHVLARAEALARLRSVAIEVRFEGGTEDRMRAWLGDGYRYRRQGGGDIGERMRLALADAFNEEVERAVLIGSDIPGITADLLATAFDRLEAVDIVLGPAADGGYYLIGLHRTAWSRGAGELFDSIPWGGAHVLAATRKRIDTLGFQAVLLDTLADIDRPEDLVLWERLCP